jgi:hypothetical protein
MWALLGTLLAVIVVTAIPELIIRYKQRRAEQDSLQQRVRIWIEDLEIERQERIAAANAFLAPRLPEILDEIERHR